MRLEKFKNEILEAIKKDVEENYCWGGGYDGTVYVGERFAEVRYYGDVKVLSDAEDFPPMADEIEVFLSSAEVKGLVTNHCVPLTNVTKKINYMLSEEEGKIIR